MVDITEKERADKVLTLIVAGACFVHWNASASADHSAESCFDSAERFVAEANERGYGDAIVQLLAAKFLETIKEIIE